MVRKLIPLLALLLGACATTSSREPVIVIQEVVKPVPAPCVPRELEPPPAYADNDDALKKAVDAAERYLLIVAGREQRVRRLHEIEPVVAACPKAE